MYEELEFDQNELQSAMRSTYDELIDFFTSSEFQMAWERLRAMPKLKRYMYIRDTILNREMLEAEIGCKIPDDILIQRSAFGDGRPTLFCLKKFLPEKFHSVWENVNLTFDESYEDDDVSRAPEASWQNPIRPDIQAVLIAAGVPLDDVPEAFRVTMA